MKKSEAFERATDPKQYDFDDLNYDGHTINKPIRKFFFDYLSRYKQLWQNASILDIGTGSGWLLDALLKNGAKEVEGIEPSIKNISVSKELFPKIKIYNKSLEDFQPNKKYDIVIGVMSFSHIADLESTFKKIKKMLKTTGELQLIIPNYDYFRKKKPYREILKIEEMNPEEYILLQKRHFGTIADIIRKPEVYEKNAIQEGFKCLESVQLQPNQELISKEPRYEQVKDDTIAHLLRFRMK